MPIYDERGYDEYGCDVHGKSYADRPRGKATLGTLTDSTVEPKTCPECGSMSCICEPDVPTHDGPHCDCHECSPVIGLDGRAI